MATPAIEVDGLLETLRAFQGLERDMRRVANGELRDAARTCANGLAVDLRSAAGGGPPVAPRVAGSIAVRSDRLPTVAIGGSRRVGRRGAPAAKLLWGSEHGPAGAINHFAVAANSAGYWIAPTTKAFKSSRAIDIFKRAVFDTMKRWRLV